MTHFGYVVAHGVGARLHETPHDRGALNDTVRDATGLSCLLRIRHSDTDEHGEIGHGLHPTGYGRGGVRTFLQI